MNINRISNMNFKGAYIVCGKGDDVKKAEVKIKDNINCSMDIPFEYTSADMPAYLFVATDEDAKKYDDFIRLDKEAQESCFEKMANKIPEARSRDDFESMHEYILYKLHHQARVWAAAIGNNCDFEEVRMVDGERVLEAMQHNNFDYLNGKILDKEA